MSHTVNAAFKKSVQKNKQTNKQTNKNKQIKGEKKNPKIITFSVLKIRKISYEKNIDFSVH